MAVILLWPGALVIGFSLGLMGSGGSILTVPVLRYLLGQDEKVAIAGSLAIVGIIALAGSVSYIRERLVDWRTVVLFGVPGMAGTYGGAWASGYVSGTAQLGVFAVVMALAGYFMLKSGTCAARDAATGDPSQRRFWRIGADGVVVGVVTGFAGVGGGFLIVPALMALGGLPMVRAVATSLVIIAFKSFVGFIKYQDVLALQGHQLDYTVILSIAALGIAGSVAGAHTARQLPKEKLQRGFGVMLVIMGICIFSASLAQTVA